MSQHPTAATDSAPPDRFGGCADPWWRDCAERAVRDLAATGRPFQLSEIRDERYAIPAPHHPGAWGALALALAAAGVIEAIGYAPSAAPSRHGAIVKIWRGKAAEVAA